MLAGGASSQGGRRGREGGGKEKDEEEGVQRVRIRQPCLGSGVSTSLRPTAPAPVPFDPPNARLSPLRIPSQSSSTAELVRCSVCRQQAPSMTQRPPIGLKPFSCPTSFSPRPSACTASLEKGPRVLNSPRATRTNGRVGCRSHRDQSRPAHILSTPVSNHLVRARPPALTPPRRLPVPGSGPLFVIRNTREILHPRSPTLDPSDVLCGALSPQASSGLLLDPISRTDASLVPVHMHCFKTEPYGLLRRACQSAWFNQS